MDKNKEAMQERLKDYPDDKWDEVNNIIAEYSSMAEEKEIEFSVAIKSIIKALKKIGT